MADTKRVRELPVAHLRPNWLIDDILTSLASLGVLSHYGQGGDLITAADASDLATLKTLVKDCSDAQVLHGLDTGVHSAADAAMDEPAGYASSPAEPADLAECQAIINQLKDDLNTHLALITPHRSVSGRSGGLPLFTLITVADGSDQATNEALANEYKACFNRHATIGYADFLVD